ncbi:hypothetical protein LCGC14_2074410 [marine sediment metagenome]|uniref:Uncharacterized protein n=1 Tax=marine sediment metagenome TaxID=412755 RepID=A0A0F9GVS5_9ZZZZ
MTMDTYMKELSSSTCFCGSKKQSMNSFCLKCYFMLSKKLRNELYRPIENGYTEAYEESINHLTERGVKRK